MQCRGSRWLRCTGRSGTASTRTRTTAESTAGPIVAAVRTDIDGNGCYLRRACPVPMRYALHVLARSGIGAASSLLLCPHRPPTSVSRSGCFASACARADCLHAQVLRTWCHSSCMCVRAYCLLLMRAAEVQPMQPHTCPRTASTSHQSVVALQRLMCLLCGGMAAALERTAQPDAMEWLWC